MPKGIHDRFRLLGRTVGHYGLIGTDVVVLTFLDAKLCLHLGDVKR